MRCIRIFLVVAACLYLAGCASYQVGTPGSRSFDTVYVEPVVNASAFPNLEASLTTALRNELSRFGGISLAGRANADALLKVEVNEQSRSIAAAQSIDVGLGRKFELTLNASCSLYDLRNEGAAIFENRQVEIDQDIYVDNDLSAATGATRPESAQINAEHQATPVIAEKIARRVASLTFDTW